MAPEDRQPKLDISSPGDGIRLINTGLADSEITVSVGASGSTLLVSQDPTRIYLLMVNNGGAALWLSTLPNPAATKGLPFNGGQAYEFFFSRHGPLVTRAWTVFNPAATVLNAQVVQIKVIN